MLAILRHAPDCLAEIDDGAVEINKDSHPEWRWIPVPWRPALRKHSGLGNSAYSSESIVIDGEVAELRFHSGNHFVAV